MPDLHQSIFHRIRAHFPPNWQPITCSKATLIDFSHAIEDTFILHRLSGACSRASGERLLASRS